MEKEIICIVCPKGCKINARVRSECAGGNEDTSSGGVCKGMEATVLQSGIDGFVTEGTETVYEITGHSCTRGYEYALSECTNPVRTLTTTVRLLYDDTDKTMPVLVPVKSSAPLPKDLLKECVKVVNSVTVRPPIRIGDVIVRDILGTGSDIIATANITGEECKWRSGSSSRSTRGRQARGQSSSTASAEK